MRTDATFTENLMNYGEYPQQKTSSNRVQTSKRDNGICMLIEDISWCIQQSMHLDSDDDDDDLYLKWREYVFTHLYLHTQK